MQDVSIRVRSGRALLDSANAWAAGQIRDPAKMATGTIPGQPGNLRGSVEKSSEDHCVRALPFDYSVLSNSGRPSDPGSDEPKPDLDLEPGEAAEPAEEELEPAGARSTITGTTCEHEPEQTTVPTVVAPTISIQNEQEIRQEMQTTAVPKVSLVKHNQIKALALSLMADRFTFNGEPKFTRVSPQFCEAAERFLYAAIVNAIRRHPSVGKIIKEF